MRFLAAKKRPASGESAESVAVMPLDPASRPPDASHLEGQLDVVLLGPAELETRLRAALVAEAREAHLAVVVERCSGREALMDGLDRVGPAAVLVVDVGLGELELERVSRLLHRLGEPVPTVGLLRRRDSGPQRATWITGLGQLGLVEVISLDGAAGELLPVLRRTVEVHRLRHEARWWRERFHEAYNRSLNGFYRVDPDGWVLDANVTLARLLGYETRDDVVGRQLEEIDDDGRRRPLRRPGPSRPFWRRPVRLVCCDGSVVQAVMNDLRVAVDRKGRLVSETTARSAGEIKIGFEGILHETRRERELEEQLREREALYLGVFDAMIEAAALLDREGTVLACNRSFERLLGVSARTAVGSALGDNLGGLFTHDGEPLALEKSPVVAGDAEVLDELFLVERLDRVKLRVSVRRVRVPAPGGERRAQYLLSLVDRSSPLEPQRVRQLRGRSMHDLRNYLSVIVGTSDLLAKATTGASDQVVRQAGQIRAASHRAINVLRHELDAQAAAVRERRTTVPVGLDALVRSSEGMLRSIVGRDIQLSISLHCGPRRAMADPEQLERILINLVRNAVDALTHGGQVAVSTAPRWLEACPSARATRPFGRRTPEPGNEIAEPDLLLLRVKDTGIGMPEEVRERAFEPYFTTKTGGTGLGLAAVADYVRSIDGVIEIQSESGVGTEVRIGLVVAGDGE